MMTLILLLSAVCCRVAAGPLGHLTEPSTRPAFKVEQLNIVRMLQDACIAALHNHYIVIVRRIVRQFMFAQAAV